MEQILKLFPLKIAETLAQNIGEKFKDLEEIRIRVDKPIILKFLDKEQIIHTKITRG